MEAWALLVLCVLSGTLAGPINLKYPIDDFQVDDRGKQCATHCTGSAKFLYEPDKTYQYDYEALTVTGLHGASADVSKLDVKARVNIHVMSQCEMALTLSDVTITRSDPYHDQMLMVDDWEFKTALERNPLRFSFQDGLVEDMCPSEMDDVQSLNFKRGVLSAFQNSMTQHNMDESMKEIDVTGSCPTEYKVAQRGLKTSQFTKTKDLLGCVDRHDYRTSMQSTPFRVPDAIQSLPLLKGNHKCTQVKSREGHILSSTCIESLVFRPFSKKEAGARTETTQRLNHVNTMPGARMSMDYVPSRSSLLFEHQITKGDNDQSLWSAREKLTELCRITVQDIPAEAPALFTDLVYLMRNLDTPELIEIADRVQRGDICEDNKEKARKFYLDALPMTGTESAIEVMVNMMLAGEVVDSQAEVWIASLHFVQHPKMEMLAHVKKLLSSNAYQMSSLLPVTTLANQACRTQTDCMTDLDMGDIVYILSDILDKNCQSGERDLILMTLRAVGNLGYSDALASTLEKCMKLSNNPLSIRVSAAQAFRGITCNTDRGPLMETFMNTNEDSELRIAAYLSIMQCWDEATLQKVKQALKMEKVNQVGSFVWTHLTNLMETSSLYKQELKDILDDEELEKEFNMDRRKYSRNYEISFFSDKFGTGAMAESNLIWSSKSFLPRSAMLNLTVDMLGHSINLLEVGGRVEGLEAILQKYLGSSGLFPGGEKLHPGAQSRCVKQQKMDAMKDKFSMDKEGLSASAYVRMFGSELGFHHYTEQELMDLKEKYSIKNILSTLAKNKDISFTKSGMFLDSSLSVPTIAGMSLTLSVNGTATVELIANGKMDLRKLSLKKMEATFDVRPSGAVQLSGMMTLGAGATRSGLKMITTLHTSTSVSGYLDLTNGQVLTMELDTPKRNMDIIDVKSEFFSIHNQAEKKQNILQNKQVNQHKCSSETILKVLGYELCGALSFVNMSDSDSAPYFPFNGAMNAAISLHKKDAPRGFKLIGKYIHNKVTSTAQLSFDTPGSLVERGITVGYFLDTQAKSLEAEMSSPWKKILAKGSYTVQPQSRKMSATVLDDGREYKLHMQMDQDKKKTKTIWIPSLEIVRPSDAITLLKKAPQKLTVDGKVEIDIDQGDMSTEFTVNSGIRPDPIEIRGNLINKARQVTAAGSITLNKKEAYSATFQVLRDISSKNSVQGKLEPTILISTPKWRPLLLSGTIDFKEDKLLKGNLALTLDETLKDPVNLDFKITKQLKKTNYRYRINGKFNSQFATVKTKGSINVASKLTSQRGPLLTSRILVDYNLPIVKDRSLRRNRVLLSSKVHDRSTKALKKFDINFNLDSKYYPEANIVSSLELSHKDTFTKSVLSLKKGAKAKYTKDKTSELRVETSINHQVKDDSADIQWGFLAIYPQEDIEYEIKGKHEHSFKNKFSFETYTAAIYDKGKSVEIRLLGRDNSKQNFLDASGSLELNFPAFEIDDRKYDSRQYKILTTIMQNVDKEYIHTINLQVNDAEKHSLVTKFSKGREQFDLYSELQIDGDYPGKAILTAVRKSNNARGSVEFVLQEDRYKAEVSSELQDKYFTYRWDVLWLERKINGFIGAGKAKDEAAVMKFETLWDANKDSSQKITSELRFLYEAGSNEDMFISITTPFKDHQIYSFKRLYELKPKSFKWEQQVILGTKEKESSYAFFMLLPPSAERFEMSFSTVTPYESFRRSSCEIRHKFDGSRHLSSSMKGRLNDHTMSLAVVLTNSGDAVRNDIYTHLNLTTSFTKCRDVFLSLRHSDDGRVFSSEGVYSRNGAQYKADLVASYFKIHYQVQVDSKLEISLPSDRPITVKWVHKNSLTNLNSTVSLNWKPAYDTKLVVGAKANKAEKDYVLDVTLLSPWKDVREIQLQIHHNEMIDFSGSQFFSLNKDPLFTIRSSYVYKDGEFTLTTSDRIVTSFKAQFKDYPYTVMFEMYSVDYSPDWDNEKIIVDASLDMPKKDDWLFNLKTRLPIFYEETRNINAKGELQKTEEAEWKFNSLLSLGVRENIKVDFLIDADKWSRLQGQILTPHKQMTNMNFGYSRKPMDSGISTESYLEMQPVFKKVRIEQAYSMEPGQFNCRYYMELPDTEIKHLEVKIEDSNQRRGYKTNVQVNYAPDKKIDLMVKRKYNENKFPENSKLIVDLSTPYEVFPSLNVKADLDKEGEDWIGQLDLKSGNKALEYLNVKVTHGSTETSCKSDFEVASSVFETVVAGAHFDWGETTAANLTFSAPSVGRSMIGFKRRSKSWTDLQNKVFAEFNGKTVDLDVGLKHDEKETKAWLLYDLPGAEHSYIKTSVHRVGNTVSDFDIGGILQVGKQSRPYNVSAQYAWTDLKVALGTTLETPYTKSLSFLIKGEMNEAGGMSETCYAKFGKRFLLDSFSFISKSDKTFDMNSRGHFKLDERSMDYGSEVKSKWALGSAEAQLGAHYNQQWVKMSVNRKLISNAEDSGKETVNVMVYTPFKDYTDIGMQAVVNMEPKRYHGSCNLEYMNEKEAVLTFDVSQPDQNRVLLNANLALPIENYRKNILTYSQTLRNNQFKADGELITGKGEHLTGKLEVKDKQEYVLTLTGPVEEFESLIVSGKYDEKENRVSGDAQMQLSMHPKPARLEYDFLLNNKPATVTLKLRTPYDNYRRADLKIEHTGKDWRRFNTEAVLDCDKLGVVNSKTSWKFQTLTDMEGSSSLTSSIQNMEFLKLGFSTKEKAGEQVRHVEVSWDHDKEITLDNSWSLQVSDNRAKFSTSVEVTTPFPELSMAIMKLAHNHSPNKFSESISLLHNSKAYLDGDLSYQYGDRHEGTVEIRQPRPMSFFMTGASGDEVFDGIVKLNWDKNSPDGHIEIISRLADRTQHPNIDKEFKFKVIHPVRVMGVECQYKKANNEILSSGMVTWNEQQGSFSYDIGFMNKSSVYSKDYDGHIKVGVPQRSVKLQGSFIDTGKSQTTSSAVWWDADKDEKKKVTMSTTVENQASMKRIGLNINVPYINKQMNLDATTKGGYGSTESRAEISYSSDPRKMIAVSAVLKNTLLGSKDNYNYTVDLTLEHPITNIDLKLLSHIARVDQICSTGGQFNFLTAHNERKTVGFWALVDRAKRNVEVKVVTPLKSVGIEGQYDEYPYQQHLQVKSFEDNKQALKLGVVLDKRRKNLDVEFNYDQDDPSKLVKFTGHYVNESAVRVDVLTQIGRETHSESMVAIRLNSSNILHTRVLWRPTVLYDWQNFMGTKVTAFSYAANEAFTEAVESIGSEVKAKYLLISEELRSEMGQVFQLMDKEMDSLSGQLETFRTEFRRFYQRNDLHIKSMGDQVQAAFQELFEKIRHLVKNYRSYYTGITKSTNDWLANLKSYPIAQKYGLVIQDLITGLKDLREVLEEILNDVAVELQGFSHESYKKYLDISRTIDRKLNSYARSLHELPIYRKMVEQRAQLEKMGPEWSQLYNSVYLKGQQILQDQFHDMMARSEFKYIHAVTSEIHQQVMYWNVEQSLNMAIERTIELTKNLMLMELTKLKKSIMDMENSRVIVYDPQRGELQFEVHLPVQLKSLAEPPEVKVDKYVEQMRRWGKVYLPSTNSSLWDSYYEYVPSLEPSSWIPPFEASAYLIGSQHFITFDKTQYDFLSSCSHVLTRDMVNDNFSVVVNYERHAQRHGIKSLCFSIGELTFDIRTDYKLEVGRRETEMPLIAENFKILREGDFIRVEYNGGVEVLLNPKLDLYKITVAGWYHGKLAGLLGNYNNENHDDEKVAEQADEYNVNRGSCNPQNRAIVPDPSKDPDNMCTKIFAESTSKFRPCFRQVEPAPFVQTCKVYMATMSENEAINLVTEQYRYVCQGHGIFIGALQEYVPCNADDSFMVEGSDPLYQSADVLFVVEDSQCNQWVSSSLAPMVTEINNALTAAGMRDNRFGLESYGGVNADDTNVRTMYGNHFGEASLFLRAVETLRFFSNVTQGNLVKAVRTARDYPYRAGVAKVLVIAPCSSCEVSFFDRNLIAKLKSEAFSVHVLQHQNFFYEGDPNSSGKFRVYGVDNAKTFTSHFSHRTVDVNDVQGAMQTDYCVSIAEETNGSVFDTAHLADKPQVQREFIQVFAQRVGWSTKLPQCQSCTCNAQFGRVECQLCNAKSIYSLIPWNRPSFHEVIGSFHDFNHDAKTYFGLAK